MLSLGTSAFVGVQSQRPNITMYVKILRAIESGIYDPHYDFDGNGVIDDADALRFKKYLLGVIPLEELYIESVEE